jgi:hypothetical protein
VAISPSAVRRLLGYGSVAPMLRARCNHTASSAVKSTQIHSTKINIRRWGCLLVPEDHKRCGTLVSRSWCCKGACRPRSTSIGLRICPCSCPCTMIAAGVSSVASRAVDGHEPGVRERALFTTAASRGGRRRVDQVFVSSWLALAGLRACLLRRAGDGGAHAHGSSYPGNWQ